MRLHAAMRDHGRAIEAFGNGLSLGECLVRIPLRLRRCFHVVRLRSCLAASGCTVALRIASRTRIGTPILLGVLVVRLPWALKLMPYCWMRVTICRLGNLVVEHVAQIVHAERALAFAGARGGSASLTRCGSF